MSNSILKVYKKKVDEPELRAENVEKWGTIYGPRVINGVRQPHYDHRIWCDKCKSGTHKPKDCIIAFRDNNLLFKFTE